MSWYIIVFDPPERSKRALARLGFRQAKKENSWWRRVDTRDQALIAIEHCKANQLHGVAKKRPDKPTKTLKPIAPEPTNYTQLRALSEHLRELPKTHPRDDEFRRAHRP